MSLSDSVEAIATLIMKILEVTGLEYDDLMAELEKRHRVDDASITAALSELESHLPDPE